MREHIVIRCPVDWEGRINSAWVESRLQDFYAHRPLLPEDPGPDGGRVSLSLARKPFRVFCALLDQPASISLRRLIAGYERELPGFELPTLPAGAPIVHERRIIDVAPQVARALPAARLGQKISRASDGALLDARTGQRLWGPDGRWVETRMDRRGNTSATLSDSRERESLLWIEVVFAVLAVMLVLVFAFRRPGAPDVGPDAFKPWVPTR